MTAVEGMHGGLNALAETLQVYYFIYLLTVIFLI